MNELLKLKIYYLVNRITLMCLPSPVVYAWDITRKSSHVKCEGLARGKQKERVGDREVLNTPEDQKNTLSKDKSLTL